jgi:hypothetical protein
VSRDGGGIAFRGTLCGRITRPVKGRLRGFPATAEIEDDPTLVVVKLAFDHPPQPAVAGS